MSKIEKNLENMHYWGNKYTCSVEELKDKLKRYGVAVIPNVLNEEEIKEATKGQWETLGHLTKNFPNPISKDDEKSWASMAELLPTKGMLIQHHGLGHAQYIWDIRQNPKIADIFAKLWNVKKEDLLCSFDGAGISLPPEITKKGFYTARADWYHLDQSPLRPDLECVQSWVTLHDVNKGDATLSVFEKSHKYIKEFQEKFNIKEKKDWYKLNGNEYKFFLEEKGCKKVSIVCPKGSMVFWDSRTVHEGIQPLRTRKEQNFRSVVYICMTPRSLISDANLKKKQKAFVEKRMTSHWPHKVILFSKNAGNQWQKMEHEVPPMPEPELTKLGKKLAGF